MSPSLEPQGYTLPVGTNLYVSFMRTIRQQDIVSFLAVFISILVAIKLNQYIFFHFNTSPAIIFLPTGIALAAVYLGGYRMWVPIAAAWFLGSVTSFSHPTLVVDAAATVGYTLEAVIGGYALARLKFVGDLARTRDAFILIAASLLLPVIAPSITASVQWLTHALPSSVWVTWSRAWAGGALNILVLLPLITTWYRDRTTKTFRKLLEITLALLALAFVTYLVFWSPLVQANGFIVLYALFAILFWIGLRMHPRIITTAVFLVMLLSFAGSLIARPTTTTKLDQQLLSDELFIVLIVPIFLILAALVEERRVKERELEEAIDKLSQEDQAKNEFLATLAHELRNPLAPIVSSLELMRLEARQLARPNLMQLIDVTDRYNAMIVHLLDDLLDISRISHRKFKLQKESLELRPVVEHAVRTVDAMYKANNHTLSVSMPEETLWIEADPLRLRQILINLLNNAAKYTNPGGNIVLSVVFDPDRGLRISVRDNGVGIEPHMLKKIFEPFVQSDESRSGLGIGLSLTNHLVNLHDGVVWAESEGLGRGSDFIVVLPGADRVRLPLRVATPKRRRREFPFIGKRSQRKRSILIVDDNKAAAESLGKLLEHGSHTVAFAYDGSSAIAKMKNAEADAVLLDIELPDMDGYEVARSLRQEHGYNSLEPISKIPL